MLTPVPWANTSALRAHAGVPAQAMCDGLLKAVTDYQGSAPQYDDITMIAAQRLPYLWAAEVAD